MAGVITWNSRSLEVFPVESAGDGAAIHASSWTWNNNLGL